MPGKSRGTRKCGPGVISERRTPSNGHLIFSFAQIALLHLTHHLYFPTNMHQWPLSTVIPSSPIFWLPNELLVSILREVHRQDGGSVICAGKATRSHNLHSAFQTVSQVNSRLRFLAFGTPTLWADIYIRDLHPARYHVLDACIRRSQACLLSIYIQDDCRVWEKSTSYLPILITCHDRWRRLSVTSHSTPYTQNIISMLRPLHTPKLETLTIEAYSDFSDAGKDNTYTPILQKGAPNLHSISLLNISLLSCCPPLSTLKELTNWVFQPTRAMSSYQLADVLRHSLSLTTLQLSSQTMLPWAGEKTPPISLPFLTDLCLDFNHLGERSLLRLFTTFETPSLKSLRIRDLVYELAASFAQFLWEQSSSRYPLLESLELKSVDLAPDLFTIDFVRPLQSITSLALLDSNEDHALEAAIASAEDSNMLLWPRLRCLKLAYCSTDTLHDFILSREEAGVGLTSLHFTDLPDYDEMEIADEEKGWLQEHVALVSFL